MKRKSSHISSRLFVILGILGIIYSAAAFYLVHSNDLRNRVVIENRMSWVEGKKDKLMYIFSDIFPRAEVCYKDTQAQICEKELRTMIDINLGDILGYENEVEGRLPIFFIKLVDQDTIGKLYQGGGYIKEKVDTKGERMVIDMLQRKRDPFAYPQYNCCGGDDIVPSLPIVNFLLPIRRYLNDFPSEIEHVYLIKDENHEIVGGLVFLYGD